MPSTLSEIVENKRAEVSLRKQATSEEQLRQGLRAAAGTFLPALRGDGIKLITEIKPKSPSAGELRSNINHRQVARLYAKFAAAISVLTDEKYFGGSLEILHEVATDVSIPTLCKDFIIDSYQITEARRAGAEAILLIVKVLPEDNLRTLQSAAQNLNMTAVVEVQTIEELKIALSINPTVLLINNRNLSTFEIDLDTTARLVSYIHSGIEVISASGIENRADIDRLLRFTNKFLIGSSLMRAGNIEDKLLELSGAPKQIN